METTLIKHVFGNVIRIAIPLTQRIRTIVEGVETETESDFYPNAEFPVEVVLTRSDGFESAYEAEMEGNVASIVDEGELPLGTYGVTVLCKDSNEHPCRYMARAKVKVVAATEDAGIEAGVEFDATDYTLEGTIYYYAKGDKGEDYKVELSDESSIEIEELTPNVYHRWGEMESLSVLSLGEGREGELAQHMLEFRSGSTPTVLSLPDDILWKDGINPTENIKADKAYRISIINNLGMFAEF